MKVAKKIYVENAEIFDGILELESAVTGKTLSFLIENHIIDGVLKTKSSKYYAELMLSHGLDKSLESLYDYIAIGNNWHSKYTNTKELVEFSRDICGSTRIQDVNYMDKSCILSWIDSLYSKMDNWLEENPITDSSDYQTLQRYSDYNRLAGLISDLFAIYTNDFNLFVPANIFMIVLQGWEVFSDWTITYNLLAAIHSTMKGRSFPNEIKWEFIQILNKMTLEWDN